MGARVRSLLQWLRRGRASVRVRVTLLAAGGFAVSFFVAAALLLNTLEDGLVGDVRNENEAALVRQSLLIGEAGVPSVAGLEANEDGTVTYYFENQVFALAPPTGMTFDEYERRLSAGEVAALPPTVSQQRAAITGAVTSAGAEADVLTSTIDGPGGAVLATMSPLDEIRDTINTTTKLLWFVGPALVALVAGLAWMLAGRALRPVRRLTSQVAAIWSHSLHARVPEADSSDEIALLARTMNNMLGRLDAANASSKRLVSDASHELRTPIAVMRTELEVATRDRRNDWQATGETLLDELDRLGRLVDDLLLLARGSERVLGRQPIDALDLVRDVAGRRRRSDVRVTVDTGDAAGAGLLGDRAALQRALDHLVANAARSAVSRVVVSVDTAEAGVALLVDDDGPGIPAEHREAVVERFVRLDEARSRDAGGAGLGLAVASDVATAHGGRLEIGDSPLGGARVAIVLPAAISLPRAVSSG